MQVDDHGEPLESDFLQFSIEYLESRIALLDNKANVLLALVTATVVGLGVVMPIGDLYDRGVALWMAVAIAYAGAAGIAWLCLLVLRPRFRLGRPGKTAMWLTPSLDGTMSVCDHLELLHGSGPGRSRPRLASMRATHNKLLSNASKKMYYYHWSVIGARILTAYLVMIGAGGLIGQAVG